MFCGWCGGENLCYITGSQLLQATALYLTFFQLIPVSISLPAMRELVLAFLKHMCYGWCCRRNPCHITGSQLPQATALYFTLFLLTLAWIYPTCHEIFIAPTFSNTCVVVGAVGKIRVTSLAPNCHNLQHCIIHIMHNIFYLPWDIYSQMSSNTCVVGDAVGKIRVTSLAPNCYNLHTVFDIPLTYSSINIP